jgi:gamma-glutamyl-gamma-aminobutyrate hydrolase PuuD
MSKVYIEAERFGLYHQMWRSWGWDITDNIEDADVCQFTGGADVSPSLYNKFNHPRTFSNADRDAKCKELYDTCLRYAIPMIGICRGGQFLNVMNGGEMVQHADGHAMRGMHKATILENQMEIEVTSTHHQIMIPNYDAGIVLMESQPLGTFKETTDSNGRVIQIDADDVESIYYDDTCCLCFQPHPEFASSEHVMQQALRMFIRNYLGLDVPN